MRVGLDEAVDVGSAVSKMDWANFWFRVAVGVAITGLFIAINLYVVGLIENCVSNDHINIISKYITADHRLVTENVLMSLIAGTVAQIITLMIGIVRYIFPSE